MSNENSPVEETLLKDANRSDFLSYVQEILSNDWLEATEASTATNLYYNPASSGSGMQNRANRHLGDHPRESAKRVLNYINQFPRDNFQLLLCSEGWRWKFHWNIDRGSIYKKYIHTPDNVTPSDD